MHISRLLPPAHPATHGGINIDYSASNGVIEEVKIEIGLMHRGAEKLMEYRDYRQGAMLANRHIWTSPTAGEYAFVLAAEEMLGMQVTSRASALRAIYCEIDRIISHLTFLQAFPGAHRFSVREEWADFMERATGARMHHQVIRIGGVAFALDREQVDRIAVLQRQTSADITGYSIPNEFSGHGVLTNEVASRHGVTGPIARASGIVWDERMSNYGWYHDFQAVSESAGDIPARIRILVDEVHQSLHLIKAAIDAAMSDGEILLRTPKTIRLPEGSAQAFVEGALGANGVSLYSTGGRAPDRVRLRTASLGNLSALEEVLVGMSEAALAPMLASWPFLAGDSDR